MRMTFALAALAALLAACSPPPERLAMDMPQSSRELRPLVRSVLVRTVVLPTHAAVEEVSVQAESGLIVSNEDILWADDPSRAVTLMLSQNLADILNTDVAPEPWPFVELPDAAVDVRVGTMLALADGTFRLSGQFFVGGDRIAYPDTVDSFSISIPITGEGLGAVSRAQGLALVELSERIATRLAR